jgi:hypothetical protein
MQVGAPERLYLTIAPREHVSHFSFFHEHRPPPKMEAGF